MKAFVKRLQEVQNTIICCMVAEIVEVCEDQIMSLALNDTEAAISDDIAIRRLLDFKYAVKRTERLWDNERRGFILSRLSHIAEELTETFKYKDLSREEIVELIECVINSTNRSARR